MGGVAAILGAIFIIWVIMSGHHQSPAKLAILAVIIIFGYFFFSVYDVSSMIPSGSIGSAGMLPGSSPSTAPKAIAPGAVSPKKFTPINE